MIILFCSDDSTANEKTVLHIAEETDDDLLASTPATHTTEDLFTIIHRFAHMGARTYHPLHQTCNKSYLFWRYILTLILGW